MIALIATMKIVAGESWYSSWPVKNIQTFTTTIGVQRSSGKIGTASATIQPSFEFAKQASVETKYTIEITPNETPTMLPDANARTPIARTKNAAQISCMTLATANGFDPQ
jgi:hypothetical protein